MTHYLKDGEASKAFLEKIPLGRFGSGGRNCQYYLVPGQ